jgi:hypothetical protein
MPIDECRRWRLWKISRYSKIAFRQFDPGRPDPSVQELDLHPASERLDHGVIEATSDRAHRGMSPESSARLVSAQLVNCVPWSEL